MISRLVITSWRTSSTAAGDEAPRLDNLISNQVAKSKQIVAPWFAGSPVKFAYIMPVWPRFVCTRVQNCVLRFKRASDSHLNGGPFGSLWRSERPNGTWGIRCWYRSRLACTRFIPTHMEHTPCVCNDLPAMPVHPHAHGAYGKIAFEIPTFPGSSLRTWSILSDRFADYEDRRFIPTHMEHTKPGNGLRKSLTVHPHAHGAYGAKVPGSENGYGSSPRTWSILFANKPIDTRTYSPSQTSREIDRIVERCPHFSPLPHAPGEGSDSKHFRMVQCQLSVQRDQFRVRFVCPLAGSPGRFSQQRQLKSGEFP